MTCGRREPTSFAWRTPDFNIAVLIRSSLKFTAVASILQANEDGTKKLELPSKKRERNKRKTKLMLRSFLLVPVSSITTRFLALFTAFLFTILGSLSLTRTTHFGRTRILDTQHI